MGSWPKRLPVAAAWGIGMLFIVSALTKIAGPASFALAVKHFRVLPLWAVNIPALLLPWCELTAGVALLSNRWRKAGAVIVLSMLCAFVGAIGAAMVRGLDISCGCFGEASGKAGAGLLVLDLLLIATTALILRSSPSSGNRLDRDGRS